MQAPLITGQLPLGYCWPSSPQQFANDLFSISNADVPNNVTGVAFGPTDPGPDFPLWFNTTRAVEYFLNPTLGIRTSLYWPKANPGIKMWVEMTEVEIAALDNDGGGQVLVFGAETYTGPFWTIDHSYDGRSPLGVGPIPGTLPARTAALGDSLGEGDHVQLPTEIVPHTHNVTYDDAAPDAKFTHWSYDSGSPNGSKREPLGAEPPTGTLETTITAQASPDPNVGGNVIHPVKVGYMIQRTARIWMTL